MPARTRRGPPPDDGAAALRKAFPDLPIAEKPWPRLVLEDGTIDLLGKLGRRWWLRLRTERAEEAVKEVPGAVRVGLQEIVFPLYGGHPEANINRCVVAPLVGAAIAAPTD